MTSNLAMASLATMDLSGILGATDTFWRFMGEMSGAEATPERLGLLMAGSTEAVPVSPAAGTAATGQPPAGTR